MAQQQEFLIHLSASASKTARIVRFRQLKAGYRRTGTINKKLAEAWLPADNEQQISYETTLSECE